MYSQSRDASTKIYVQAIKYIFVYKNTAVYICKCKFHYFKLILFQMVECESSRTHKGLQYISGLK